MENPTFLADDYDGNNNENDKERQDTINHQHYEVNNKNLKKNEKVHYDTKQHTGDEERQDTIKRHLKEDDKTLKEKSDKENENDKSIHDDTKNNTNKSNSVDNNTLTPIELPEIKSNENGIDNKIDIDDDNNIEILEIGTNTENTFSNDDKNTEPTTESDEKNTETSLSTSVTLQDNTDFKPNNDSEDSPKKDDFHENKAYNTQEEKPPGVSEGLKNTTKSEKTLIDTQNIDMNKLPLKDKTTLHRTISSHESQPPTNIENNRDSNKKSFECPRYGWGRVTPRFLQFMNKPAVFLLLLSIAGAAQGLVVTGVSFTILTSIEKQFGFSSSHVGLFGTVYDGGFGVLCVVVGFLGHRNKPRWIGAGMIVMAAGAVLLSVPKYIIGGYHAGIQRDTDFCRYTQGEAYIPECGGSSPWYFTMIFLAGNLIMGIGATPLYVLGPAHIDEITTRGQNGLYNGIFAMSAALGPAIGFIIGLPILNTWVDIEEVSLKYFLYFLNFESHRLLRAQLELLKA